MIAIKRTPLWSGDPRVKPPFGSVEIDRVHPLAPVLMWVLNKGAGPTDVLTTLPKQPVVTQTATVKWVPTAGGLGLNFSGNAFNQCKVTPNIYSGGPSFTVIAKATIFADALFILSAVQGYGGPWELRVVSTPIIQFMNYAVGAPISTGTVTLNTPHVFAGRQTAATEYSVFLDGVQTAGGAPPGGAGGAITGNHCIGNRVDDNAGQAGNSGAIVYVAWFDRALSNDAILAFSDAPYAVLRPLLRRRYSVPAGGATIIEADFTAAGVGAAASLAAAIASGVSAAAGIATAASVAAALFLGAMASAGTATASGVSTAIAASSAQAAGAGTASSIAAAIARSDAGSSGVATAQSVSGATAGSVAASVGTAISAAVGEDAGAGSAGAAAGTGTAAAIGRATTGAVGAASGAGTAVGDGLPVGTVGADGVAAGIAIATAAGENAGTTTTLRRRKMGLESETATHVRTMGDRLPAFMAVEAEGTAAGSATGSAVGVAVGARVATAQGVATVQAVGSARVLATAAAAGSSTVLADSDSPGVSAADGAASGVAAVSGVSVAIRSALGLAEGLGTSTAVSGATAGSVGAASGQAGAAAVADNFGFTPADANAAGVGTALAVGQAIAQAAGSAAGAATVSAVATARVEATGSSAGIATVTGVSEAVAAAEADASAAGVATGAALGQAVVHSTAAAAGEATAQAVSGATAGSVGSSDGLAVVQGVGQGASEAVAAATGTAVVTGVGEDGAFAALARVVFIVPSVRATFLVPLGAGASLLGALPKQPNETFMIGADFTRRLDVGEVLVGQIITARNLTVVGDSTGLLLSAPTVAGPLASVRLTAAGTDGQDHRVQCRVITSLGNTHEVELDVRIRATFLLGRVPKQPGETFKIAADFARRLGPGETLASETTTSSNLADGLPSTAALLMQPAVAGSIAQVRLKAAGVHGENHRVQMRVVTSLANVYEVETDVAVRET